MKQVQLSQVDYGHPFFLSRLRVETYYRVNHTIGIIDELLMVDSPYEHLMMNINTGRVTEMESSDSVFVDD